MKRDACTCCGCDIRTYVAGTEQCTFCTRKCASVRIGYRRDVERGFARLAEVAHCDRMHTLRDAIEDNGGDVYACFAAVLELGIDEGERFAAEVAALREAFRDACRSE